MMTYKRLRGYNNNILNKMKTMEEEAQIKYLEKDELDHYRMSIKIVKKIEKVLKEREIKGK